jgi:methyltransferase (TIGR00027 family)
VVERAASRTAVLVCQGRAVADGRIAVGRFDDPVAYDLLRADERTVVDLVRADAPPRGLGARLEYETVRGGAAMMAARTIAIDDAVRQAAAPQLVVLGAGLDARAWRMPELAEVDAYEVDHPASQRDKRDRLGGRAPVARTVGFVAVDLTAGGLGAALRAAGYDPDRPATWVWEGVVPYLTAAEVTRAAAEVAALSAPGSTLVVNYQERAVIGRLTRLLVQGAYALGRRRSPWSGEPWRSMWSVEQMAALLRSAGFTVVRDERLLDVADHEHVATPGRPDFGRVALATRA